jgi:hypothetical protein
MSNFQKFIAMLEKFDDDLGIWGDIIGGISLVLIGIGLFVFVPLIAG